MMKIYNPFKDLSKFERALWLTSAFLVTLSFLLSPDKDYLTLIASLIGVTSLIFIAKGYVFGQILTLIFSLFYGIISYFFRYYGEMLTYLCMTAPMAVVSIVSWLKNPYGKTKEVKVKRMTGKQTILMTAFTVIVTVIFYYILAYFNTVNLFFSTLSVTTSFLACYLTFMRSPSYALAYSANDVVLIVLWTLATVTNIAYLPMILCFFTFFFNDIYAFFNWRKIEKRQRIE
ncbi:MAG: nicotinamide mononucleotide transporter [Clostridiales bacterium]|nr:nicotinamide mononucleotide transporter [Clostridiales bacterium]